jgi:1-deoxy-D-xylulose-5-phosphate synthase
LPLGKGEIRRRGAEVALLAFGSMLTPALEAAAELNATVANMRFVKPIDRELILALAAEHSLLVSVEENALIGGAGSEVARVLEEVAGTTRLLRLGIPDRFIDHGDQALLLAEIGLDRDGIVAAVRARQGSSAGEPEEIVAGSI